MSTDQDTPRVPAYDVIKNQQKTVLETQKPDQTQITALAEQINITEPAAVLSYGAKPMGEIAKFADSLLESVRAKDAGDVGQQLSELVMRIRESDPLGAEEKPAAFLPKYRW